MSIIFFDTETTGNSEGDRLCQLAVKERGIASPIVNALYKPPVPISIDSMAVHHITEKMVDGRPFFVEAPEYGSVKSLFENGDTISVAHNAAFDIAMLAPEDIVPHAIICTYKVARSLDEDEKIPSYRLQYLRYLLDLDIDATAHDAWGDVLVLEALFERLLAKMVVKEGSEESALTEMIAISLRPLLFTKFNFGKHNGKRIADVVAGGGRDYLVWLLEQKRSSPSGEGDWIYTLEYYLS